MRLWLSQFPCVQIGGVRGDGFNFWFIFVVTDTLKLGVALSLDIVRF